MSRHGRGMAAAKPQEASGAKVKLDGHSSPLILNVAMKMYTALMLTRT